MKKHILIFISIFATAPVVGMQQQPSNPTTALRPWVQNASKIQIYTLTKGHYKDTNIQPHTTILDVKNDLLNSEGFPISYQLLHARSLTGPIFWRTVTHSPLLQDTQNVKQIMNQYNTDTFLLLLHMPNNGAHNDDLGDR